MYVLVVAKSNFYIFYLSYFLRLKWHDVNANFCYNLYATCYVASDIFTCERIFRRETRHRGFIIYYILASILLKITLSFSRIILHAVDPGNL